YAVYHLGTDSRGAIHGLVLLAPIHQGGKMTEPTLVPGRIVYSYHITGPCFFAYEGKQVEAAEFYVETDPHYPERFAAQIITKNYLSMVCDSVAFSTWSAVARGLFRYHSAAMRQAGMYVCPGIPC